MTMPSVSIGGILEWTLYTSTYILGVIYLVQRMCDTEIGRSFINLLITEPPYPLLTIESFIYYEIYCFRVKISHNEDFQIYLFCIYGKHW